MLSYLYYLGKYLGMPLSVSPILAVTPSSDKRKKRATNGIAARPMPDGDSAKKTLTNNVRIANDKPANSKAVKQMGKLKTKTFKQSTEVDMDVSVEPPREVIHSKSQVGDAA
jgi:hypothetical protein